MMTALLHLPNRPVRNLPVLLSGAALAVIALSSFTRMPTLLLWNASASVPEGLYFVQPGTRPRVGEIAVVTLPPAAESLASSRGYLPSGVLLIKPVAATSQAQVCRRGDQVSVDGRTVGLALSTDSAGRSLPTWQGCLRLGARDVFVMNPAIQDSFDGRYFGPVSGNNVVGRAHPLLTISPTPRSQHTAASLRPRY